MKLTMMASAVSTRVTVSSVIMTSTVYVAAVYCATIGT